MSLAEWNLLLNALMAALMIGYGFWIHHVVKQQEKLKDATIQTLQAALTTKDAEISGLKADTAPNIATKYEQMRQHADKMTGDVIKLEEEIRKGAVTAEFLTRLSEVQGLNLANRILVEKLGKFMQPMKQPPTHQELWESITLATLAIDVQSDQRIQELEELLDKRGR